MPGQYMDIIIQVIYQFSKLFQWAKYTKCTLSDILFGYVCQPGNVFIPCLHHDYFSNTSQRRHLVVTDNSQLGDWCFCLFWMENSPFESYNHWSCLLIMFDYLSTQLSRLDTNCHCLHSKYLLTTCTLISDLHNTKLAQFYIICWRFICCKW